MNLLIVLATLIIPPQLALATPYDCAKEAYSIYGNDGFLHKLNSDQVAQLCRSK